MNKCRLVAYSGSGKIGYLIGCKLTREQAGKLRAKLLPDIIASGFKSSMVFIEEYIRYDYKEVFANAWRVKVVFRKTKKEFGNDHKANYSKLVDRGHSIIYGQGLSYSDAYYLKLLAESIYKVKYFKDGVLLKERPDNTNEYKKVSELTGIGLEQINPVIMESYGQDAIEVHNGLHHSIITEDGEHDYVNEFEYFKHIGKVNNDYDVRGLNGKSLKRAITKNLSFTSLGHSRDKDSKWELGQLDFTSYNLKSNNTGYSIDIDCINPYQSNLSGVSTLPKEKRVRVSKQWAGSGLENKRVTFVYSQMLEHIRLYIRMGYTFSEIAKYLKPILYIRNATSKNIHDAFFVLSDKIDERLIIKRFNIKIDHINKSYIKAPNALITKLIKAAIM